MFKVNKPLLIPKKIKCDIAKYSMPCQQTNILPCHLKFATWKKKPRIFHDMAWNILEEFFLLK
jgi:hypothetical protein